MSAGATTRHHPVPLSALKIIAATAVLTGVFIFTSPSPALAHDTSITGPTACGPLWIQTCGVASVYASHTGVSGCDIRNDGHGFGAAYRLKSGTTGYVPDTNGSQAGCGFIVAGSFSNPVIQIQACRTGFACTPWVDA